MKRLAAAFSRYLAAGALTTVIGLSVIWGSMYALALHPAAANAVGYAVALGAAFHIHRIWTFSGARPGAAGARPARFLAAFAAAYAANLVALGAALSLAPGFPYLCQLAGMAAYTGVFFLLNRYWVFPAPAGAE